MTANDIEKLIREAHTKDVVVTECKDGPSWGGTMSRMDAWVMNRSWSHLCFTGYEIKVSRQDFIRDNKWHNYLPLCNQLYFVCPKNLISKDEVPSGVGLKYATDHRLLTIKKAEHRNIEPPSKLLCYVLMCRTVITGSRYFCHEPEDELRRRREWLARKKESREIGDMLKYEIAREIDGIKRENKALKKRLDFINQAEKVLRSMGIQADHFYETKDEHISECATKFLNMLPEGIEFNIEQLERQLTALKSKIASTRSRQIPLTTRAESSNNGTWPAPATLSDSGTSQVP